MIGVLCIHGYTGSAWEVAPVVELLKRETNWRVEVAYLSGHNIDLQLRGVRAKHWLQDIENAYLKLRRVVDEVYVIGFSMGGLLAIYLAAHYDIKKIVLLSAAAKLFDVKQQLFDIRALYNDMKNDRLLENVIYQRYQKKVFHVPIASAFSFLKTRHFVKNDYARITQPIFLVQGDQDGLVPHHTADWIASKVSSRDVSVWHSTTGKHHICYSDDFHLWSRQLLQFLMS